MWTLWMAAAAAADWGTVIEEVVGSVLVLRYEKTRAFDGDSAGTPQASGFIVDAERGIVLTNRHVVGSGPQVAHALFPNHEEITIEPLYADPIHDFGFYRYDPAAVKLNTPRSLTLSPEGATVGAEIRLIGNDAGEQISILDGTISRVDRSAPWWDMNMFYVQAASDSSGGSSGSPVFDGNGDVVALNAGGRTRESTSYYLRLERVKRALEALQNGLEPTRGTVMTEFRYQPYDELRRLGLTDASERRARSQWQGTGMLVVATVALEGPATGKLQPGDILLEVDDGPVYDFAVAEQIWDENVGEVLPVAVERGGKRIELELTVADLHATQPTEFLEFGSTVFHEVAFRETARRMRPPRGVVVATRGQLLSSLGSNKIIEAVDDTAIDSVDTLQELLLDMKIGQVFSLTYTELDDPNTRQVERIRMPENVYRNQRCSKSGLPPVWTCAPLPHPTERLDPKPARVSAVEVQHKPARAVAQRLVTVSGRTLFPLHSVMNKEPWVSAGLVIDAERGLVLTDRWAVAHEASSIFVQAGDSGRVPAEIVSLDPLRNVALVRYDPSLLDLGLLAPLRWADEDPTPDGTYVAALLDDEGRIFSEPRSFSRFNELSLEAHRQAKYRADNLETLDVGSVENVRGGVIVDKKGRVVGLVQNFRDETKGRAHAKLEIVSAWAARDRIEGRKHLYNGVDLARSSLAKAREAGVPDTWLAKLRAHRSSDPVVMEAWRAERSVTDIRAGDFLLAVDSKPVASFREVQQATVAGAVATVVRNGTVLDIPMAALEIGQQSERAILWGGALVQEEHPEVAREAGTPARGVYLSWFYAGAPVQRYGLRWGTRIVGMNGAPITDLTSFLDAVDGLKHGQAVRVALETPNGRPWSATLRADTRWWPTQVLTRQGAHWTQQE